MIIKKCLKCNSLIKVFNDYDNTKTICCDEEMLILKPNSVDANVEKHVPEYEIIDNKINVKVNHVMEEDHYIEWIGYETNNIEQIVYFKPGSNPTATFKYVKGATLYAYCNKHLLWMKKVD